jgi:spermidine synthase
LREVLKWKSVKKVYLVDIDSCVVKMGKNILQGLNCNAFSDPRVEVVIDDGRRFLEDSTQKIDVIMPMLRQFYQ